MSQGRSVGETRHWAAAMDGGGPSQELNQPTCSEGEAEGGDHVIWDRVLGQTCERPSKSSSSTRVYLVGQFRSLTTAMCLLVSLALFVLVATCLPALPSADL